MTLRKKATSGFTIIELLIVIVVIGILAALILTAYGNIQGKAQASVTKNIVQQYSKGLLSYSVDNDHYPRGSDLPTADQAALSGVGGICIGTGYSDGCSSTINRGIELESFHQMLKPYVGNAPNISPHDVAITIDMGAGNQDITITGIAYYGIQPDAVGDDGAAIITDGVTDNNAGFAYFVYALDEPNAECTGGEALSLTAENGTFARNGAKNTLGDSKNTGCVVLLAGSIVQP